MSVAGDCSNPTSQGSKTSGARDLSGVRPGVSMLVIFPRSGASRPLLSYAYSGSVERFRSACFGRPASKTCRRVSCAQKRGEVVARPPLVREAESLRCETVQVEGRRPYLVTGASVFGRRGRKFCLRLPFTPRSCEIKASEANLRALALPGKTSPESSPVAQSVTRSACFGRLVPGRLVACLACCGMPARRRGLLSCFSDIPPDLGGKSSVVSGVGAWRLPYTSSVNGDYNP